MPNVERMVAAKEAAEEDLLSKKNVVGVAVGRKYTDGERTGELAIVVYVSSKGGRLAAADRVPEEIDGIQTDVIEADFEPKTNKLAVADIEPLVDTGTYDPLVGGISIGPCRAIGGFVFTGTLGCIVTDDATGDPMLLTNFHVAAVDAGWSVGDDQCQPSRVDTGSCPSDVVGSLQRAVLNASVDGAVVSQTARTIDCRIEEIGEVKGTALASIGDSVRKRGRTTELTYGEVDSVAATVTVPYDPSIGDVTLTNQIIIAADTTENPAFGISGDSGSAVVNENNEVVGLFFAGNGSGTIGVANPIAAVEAELGVTVYTCPTKVKEFKEIKEFKDFKEFKEKDKDFKEFKEFKEKDFKEIKEKDKDFKEFKELKEKDKDKDIFEGPINRPPLDRPPVDRPFGGLEERLAGLEQAVAGLQHFIGAGLRPEMSGSPLNREADVDQARIAELQRELYGQAQAAQAAKDAADTPGWQ